MSGLELVLYRDSMLQKVPLTKNCTAMLLLQVLEGVVSRLFCQRALWQRDPQRVTKFLLLSARDQFRKRMNEQGGMVRKTIYFVDTSCGRTQEMFKSLRLFTWARVAWFTWGEQGWRSGESTRLPPMWPGFKSRHWHHMWVEFVVGSLPCSKRFFSGYSSFPLSSKSNISKFQFDQESGRRRTTMWMCYLQIIIYLFIIYLFIWMNMCFFHFFYGVGYVMLEGERAVSQ